MCVVPVGICLKTLTEQEASSSSVGGAHTGGRTSDKPMDTHMDTHMGAQVSRHMPSPGPSFNGPGQEGRGVRGGDVGRGESGGGGQHAFASTPTLDRAHHPDWREVWCGKDPVCAAHEGGAAEGGSASGGWDEEGGGEEGGEGGRGSARRDATSSPAPKNTSVKLDIGSALAAKEKSSVIISQKFSLLTLHSKYNFT